MKWKRQSSIFFWLNIIYIRTKVAQGILLDVRLPKMSWATAQQILVMLLPRGPFLKSPGKFSGPKSNIQIEI